MGMREIWIHAFPLLLYCCRLNMRRGKTVWRMCQYNPRYPCHYLFEWRGAQLLVVVWFADNPLNFTWFISSLPNQCLNIDIILPYKYLPNCVGTWAARGLLTICPDWYSFTSLITCRWVMEVVEIWTSSELLNYNKINNHNSLFAKEIFAFAFLAMGWLHEDLCPQINRKLPKLIVLKTRQYADVCRLSSIFKVIWYTKYIEFWLKKWKPPGPWIGWRPFVVMFDMWTCKK